MLQQASTFCATGAMLDPENLEIASLYRLGSQWRHSSANHMRDVDAKGMSQEQRWLSHMKKWYLEPWVGKMGVGRTGTVIKVRGGER